MAMIAAVDLFFGIQMPTDRDGLISVGAAPHD
jgi:hypothetical protein